METKMSEVSKAMTVWELELASKAPETQRAYKRYFERFLDRWTLDPDELYDGRLKDLSSSDPRDHKRVERMVTSQMAEMKRSGLVFSTCRMLNKAVNSFFAAQGLDLRVRAKAKPKGEAIGKRMITPEEMRILWDDPGMFRLRNRALLTFAKDSGLRVSDIAAMTCRLYLEVTRKENIDGESFKAFRPYETVKEGIIAHIHIGPETVEAIDTYLEYRQGRGETLSPDSPLFAVGLCGQPASANLNPVRRFTPELLSQFFQRWRTRCGLTTEVSAHSLRKFHLAMLQTGGVPDTWISKLQGKSTKTAFGVYSRPEELPGELTRVYIMAYDQLRIFGKAESEALENLRLMNEKLTTKLEERDDRMTQIEIEIDRLTKLGVK